MSTTEYFTAEEVAAILKVSPQSVIQKFCDRPGVIDLGSPETRRKRRYRVLRIPLAVLNTYIHERSVR